ncbi:C6 transcription factor-like protein [Polychaeton citri CBS 116435]|uniref:C6 transcription factor-like protein n=1 Tax=Polychaeton citri CBS 116435 TaxID=1314669 RepID=A0A9P4Q8N4_9PEZI|nr:C6 transcription factor-like protein [Polychaeton citri CBS 116435]
MSSVTTTHASPQDLETPTAGQKYADEYWSDAGDDEENGSPKRKRQRTDAARPMSVSCELCKQRKVGRSMLNWLLLTPACREDRVANLQVHNSFGPSRAPLVVKCDRGHPSCGWCVRNGQPCEYKERKKPGLRAGYGRELEARLDTLEGVIQAQNAVIQQMANSLPGLQGIASHLQSSPSQTQAETALFLQRPSSSYIPHQGQTQNFSSQYASPSGISPYTPHPHAQSKLGIVNPNSSEASYTAPNTQVESASMNVQPISQHVLHQPGSMASVSQDQDFPPYDLLYALTDLFFKHINTWCPILHRRTTLDSLFGPSTLDEADRILLHSIVATTMRFSTDARLTEQARERYHAISKQRVLLYGMENSSVKALQALVILALDIVGSSNGPPGWNLLALITRSVVQLGLAVEATSVSVAPLYPSIYTLRAMVLPEPNNFIEDESRRRLFWMIYILDRYATIATAFEFALDEKEVDRKLPCRDELFARNQHVETKWFHTSGRSDFSPAQPQNLGAFAYYIEIIGIMSQIHRFLKKPVDIGALSDVEKWQAEYRLLDNKLKSWKFSLPSEYSNMARLCSSSNNAESKIVNCIWIMLHATYHTTVIRLHSSAAYPTNRSPIFTPSFSASQRCHSAVEDICTLCTYARNNNMLTKLGPPFAFSLWVAARLLLVHGSTIDHQVSPAIYPLVETLRELGVYWHVAGRYATLLQRVCDEFQESEQAPAGANGVRETPSTVRILADMRRCAYDLDFLISRQPRQHFGAKANTVTPARTPAPNELEYLDVFDFFNMPRLPLSSGETGVGSLNGDGTQGYQAPDNSASNEFNITNFMYDANSDWFMKSSAP